MSCGTQLDFAFSLRENLDGAGALFPDTNVAAVCEPPNHAVNFAFALEAAAGFDFLERRTNTTVFRDELGDEVEHLFLTMGHDRDPFSGVSRASLDAPMSPKFIVIPPSCFRGLDARQ